MFEKWQTQVIDPIRNTLLDLIGYLPNILYALVTLAIGWLLAMSFRWLFTQLGQKTLRQNKLNVSQQSLKLNTLNSIPSLIGLLGFWIVILFFIAASLQTLGIKVLPLLGQQFGEYIPNIIISLAVFFSTYAIAKVTREVIIRGGLLENIENSQPAINVLQLVIWSIGVLIVADQLGIRSTALLIVFTILCGALFGAFAISFGLGAKIIADNLLSVRYAQKLYHVGDAIEIAGYKGTITHITATAIIVTNDDGTVHIPGSVFSREVAIVVNKS